jgi:hypothetical protein
VHIVVRIVTVGVTLGVCAAAQETPRESRAVLEDQFAKIAIQRLQQEGVPVDQALAQRADEFRFRGGGAAAGGPSRNPAGDDAKEKRFTALTEDVTRVAKQNRVTSNVDFQTPNTGARVRYQTLGQRDRKEPATLAKCPTACTESLPIGIYYVWSERNGRDTSNRDELFRLVQKAEKVVLDER